jgi:hypothetical protein
MIRREELQLLLRARLDGVLPQEKVEQLGKEIEARRMTVEELFRDDKNKRNGWALRDTQITRADRIDRLLLILALAYLLLVGIGLIARRRFRPGTWCSSNNPRQCSVFTIGRIMVVERFQVSPALALHAVVAATAAIAPNWG